MYSRTRSSFRRGVTPMAAVPTSWCSKSSQKMSLSYQQKVGIQWGSQGFKLLLALIIWLTLPYVHTGVGKCPNWTSPNYWGYKFQQIFEGDIQNPQKGTFANPWHRWMKVLLLLQPAESSSVTLWPAGRSAKDNIFTKRSLNFCMDHSLGCKSRLHSDYSTVSQ